MLLKSGLLIASVFLVGAGLGRFWLLRGSASVARTSALLALVGAFGLVLLSLLELRTTLFNVIPNADAELLWRYATTTGHGQAVQVRIALAGSLALLALRPGDREGGVGLAFNLGALALLSTFSVLSHGAVMGGWQPLLTDLVHFGAAALWAGAVVVLLLTPVWGPAERDALWAAVMRLSDLGLGAVLVLTVTGVYNSLIHAGEPAAFLSSRYALALVVKVALVAAVVLLAALNRFLFLPRVADGASRGLRAALSLEALVLVAVLVATGWLSTTAVPHGGDTSVDAFENARRLIEHLRR